MADLKAAKEQVRFDPLDQLTEEVQEFKQGQRKLDDEIQEQIKAETLLSGAIGEFRNAGTQAFSIK